MNGHFHTPEAAPSICYGQCPLPPIADISSIADARLVGGRFIFAILPMCAACAAAPPVVGKDSVASVTGPRTSYGCIDVSGPPPIVSVTGEGILYSTPDLVDADERERLTIEVPAPEVCIYAGPGLPIRTSSYASIVVPGAKTQLVRQLRRGLGRKVTATGRAVAGDPQERSGFIIFAESIAIEEP